MDQFTNLDYIAIGGIFLLVLSIFMNLLGAAKGTPEQTEKIAKPPEELISKLESEVTIQPNVEVSLETPEPPKVSWEERLFKGMSRTRNDVWGKVTKLISGNKMDEETLEELEEILFTADLSPVLVDQLIEQLKSKGPEDGDYLNEVRSFLRAKVKSTQDSVKKDFYEFSPDMKKPKVIMIVGVNGAGKTTTIGKLATKFKMQGAKVVVGACDTFRAAAVEQLEVWCNRAGVEMVRAAEGADPSGVAFDAVKKAQEINADYCIIDTAGRLHTKANLMDELAKTKRVMSKVISDAPHETLLVIDAITGQNALRQAEEFNKSLELSGLIFTKCDGSSKAGSAVSIVENLKVPIIYIGVGESVEDLNIFDLDSYLDALLGTKFESELNPA